MAERDVVQSLVVLCEVEIDRSLDGSWLCFVWEFCSMRCL
jgi:hypothetical protein